MLKTGVPGSRDRKGSLSFRFEDALVYAAGLHAKQYRKGTMIPYIAHLLGVTSLVLEHGGNEDEAIAALLHDAVEDQGGERTLEVIRGRFGGSVAKIVEGCTDTDKVPKPPWKPRKRAYLARISEAKARPPVLLVSASDKLENARAILSDYRALGDSLWQRFNSRKAGTLWYYRELVRAFKKSRAHVALVQELDRVVSEIERLATRRRPAQQATQVGRHRRAVKLPEKGQIWTDRHSGPSD